MQRLILSLLVVLPISASVQAQAVFINEVHYDNLGGDTAEAIEIAGPAGTNLSTYELELINGSNGDLYDTVSLSGTIPDQDNGYGTLNFAAVGLQNGGPDGIALIQSGSVIQFICYEGTFTVSDTGSDADGLTCTDIGVSETGSTPVGESLQLQGSGATYTDFTWAGPIAATAGSVNTGQSFISPAVSQPLVFTTPGEARTAAGWRHLAPPVEGFDIDDLANLNLVQGVPGGTNPQQYPTFGDNVFTSFNAVGFVPPASTDEVIEPGQGFFWYLYDRTFTPNPAPGNGTSTSTELTGFELSATGTVPTSDVTFMPPNYATGGVPRQFLIGNPFHQDLNVAGISSTPTRQSVLQTWDPQTGSYVMLEAGTANDVLAVWQGTIAELAPGTQAPTFFYAAASRTGSQSGPFYGRTALQPNAVSLRLQGDLDGTAISDNIAIVRFAEDAEAGWDLRDASKLLPPLQDFALLASTTLREGESWRTAVNTLPMGDVTIPVEFTATGRGQFTISADVTLEAGARAVLRDLVTGEEVNLASGDYAFLGDATDWSHRFDLVVSFATVGTEAGGVEAFRLSQPVPNPATQEATLMLTVGITQPIRAAVYDALGREVALLHDGAVSGSVALHVPTAELAPGVYVVRVAGASGSQVRHLTVTR